MSDENSLGAVPLSLATAADESTSTSLPDESTDNNNLDADNGDSSTDQTDQTDQPPPAKKSRPDQ